MILLHSLSTLDSEPVQCLIGHALNVCVLSYSTKSKELISGSWDKTARVWMEEGGEWKTKLVLDEHTQAVWGVVGVDEGKHAGGYLTGSGKSFRLEGPVTKVTPRGWLTRSGPARHTVERQRRSRRAFQRIPGTRP